MDALRVVHYFFTDGWVYEKLHGKKYKEHRHELNKFMEILSNFGKNISKNTLNEFLTLDTHLQPWWKKLPEGIETTLLELEKFPKRKKNYMLH